MVGRRSRYDIGSGLLPSCRYGMNVFGAAVERNSRAKGTVVLQESDIRAVSPVRTSSPSLSEAGRAPYTHQAYVHVLNPVLSRSIGRASIIRILSQRQHEAT